MSEHEQILKATELSKSYGEGESRVDVLRDLSLQISRGEMVAVVGPSGVGKSTLLHLLGLLDRPDAGRIEIDGNQVEMLGSPERASLRNRVLGFIFQHHYLLDELNALENVAMPMRIAGFKAAPAEKRAEQLLEQVGLESRNRHYPDRLSGGEQQRVAVARALAMQPLLLLADEPTGNLDGESSEQVFELICRLHQEAGLSSIIVTHNREIAGRCDRIISLNRVQASQEEKK